MSVKIAEGKFDKFGKFIQARSFYVLKHICLCIKQSILPL
jgi:hypothetical protein